MRANPEDGWMEPVLAGAGTDVGFESKDDAEMIAQSFLEQSSPGVEIRILPDGQHPEAET